MALVVVVAMMAQATLVGDALHYRLALYAMLVVVLIMETRVRLGFRQPRRILFTTHILSSVGFIAAAVALGFFMQSPMLSNFALVLCVAVVLTGSMLFYKGLKLAR
ncbi:MAG: hypothetical protein JWO43_96 [Candidatus Adlerbacteria bacterium]|nr:hypothetical protein [Candidatus Adlerbacteria bacterium]